MAQIEHFETRAYKVIERKDNGDFFMFNHTHHYQVWKTRKEKGLPVTEQKEFKDSPLIGRKILNKEKNKVCTIEKVVQEWYGGWYLKILMVDNIGSSCVCGWENISNFNPIILEEIETAHKTYELI